MIGHEKNDTYTVIICDGLTNAQINPAAQYVMAKDSIGRREIERLMGIGRYFGKGSLPTFLHAAVRARLNGTGIGIIMFQTSSSDQLADANSMSVTAEAFDLPVQLENIQSNAQVIKTGPKTIPWQQLCDTVEALTGNRLQLDDTMDDRIRFLVVGSHTEGRPSAIAMHLKNAFGCKHVAVSSHFIGSSEREAHFTALRHTFARHGIQVMLDLGETWQYAGLDSREADPFGMTPCVIDPSDIRESLGAERQRIIELLCMHWTRCRLRPLAGGFSGSYLFVAEGWKNDAQTEPMVLKIDNYGQMRREIDGYYEVRDLLGKHIPNFGYTVSVGDDTGVGMELATMDGKPQTLQDTFEAADVESAFSLFKHRFERALMLISDRLYRNTRKSERVIPFHQFGLNTNRQLRYLRQNLSTIETYLEKTKNISLHIDFESLPRMLNMIASNDDGIESETCVAHGDLNYQNIICDHADNVWFIDWTHCGRYPIELDFAKLENDIKFICSKELELEDLPRIKKFEEYLLASRMPADEKELPDHLKFVKWDLRYRKILSAVRIIREKCFSLKKDEDWLVYRIALLKYSVHTLSFDKRRDRGECDLQQLVHALFSSERLMTDLVLDDFHFKIRGARPQSYPPRQRISIDSAQWRFDCPEYSPPYYVSPSVLKNDFIKSSGGWADPEEYEHMQIDKSNRQKTDDTGRSLHPRGRTGISGRGLLGRWGGNPAANAVIIRHASESSSVEMLLGRQKDANYYRLPKGFVLHEQPPEEAIVHIIKREFGWHPETGKGEILYQGFIYDDRQTDHAWVEVTTFLYFYAYADAPTNFSSNREFEEVVWLPLNRDLLEELHPTQVNSVIEVVKRLESEDEHRTGPVFSDFYEEDSDQ